MSMVFGFCSRKECISCEDTSQIMPCKRQNELFKVRFYVCKKVFMDSSK